MVLLIGGADQGKRALAKTRYDLEDGDIFTCAGETLDLSCRCIEHLERYTLACVRAGLAPSLDGLSDKILICDDISCGVVPMDKTERAWREATGRFLTALAGQADTVTRVFCGLPLELKP